MCEERERNATSDDFIGRKELTSFRSGSIASTSLGSNVAMQGLSKASTMGLRRTASADDGRDTPLDTGVH